MKDEGKLKRRLMGKEGVGRGFYAKKIPDN